jgi:hypothetical protein
MIYFFSSVVIILLIGFVYALKYFEKWDKETFGDEEKII